MGGLRGVNVNRVARSLSIVTARMGASRTYDPSPISSTEQIWIFDRINALPPHDTNYRSFGPGALHGTTPPLESPRLA